MEQKIQQKIQQLIGQLENALQQMNVSESIRQDILTKAERVKQDFLEKNRKKLDDLSIILAQNA
jgi:hypothetical protein